MLEKLNKIFNANIRVVDFKPTAEEIEEGMEPCKAFMIDDVIVGNPELGFDCNSRYILEYLKWRES